MFISDHVEKDIEGTLKIAQVKAILLEGHLPLRVVFHQRLSFTEGCLSSKVVFIKGCLPTKGVFHPSKVPIPNSPSGNDMCRVAK